LIEITALLDLLTELDDPVGGRETSVQSTVFSSVAADSVPKYALFFAIGKAFA
jgi:hypothetical protein